ncbi:MAG TPA: disulfide bond formation protein B [Candidatus Paceibacterota bacterium]|jgi:disulfide bond formation protein DsbB
MTELVSSLNFFLAGGAILLQLVAVALVVSLLTEKNFLVTEWLSKHAILISFLVVLASSALTLVYSEVFGFVPCGLCWLQRVFLYPQVIILGIALWKKRRDVSEYVIGLSIPGAVIALYQHYLQMGGSEFVTCPTAGAGADCAKRILFEFGYITFPLMSFSVFAFLIILMLLARRTNVAARSASSTM